MGSFVGSFVGSVVLALAVVAAAESGTVEVVVTGLGSERGHVLVQLADSAADYDSDDDAFRHAAGKAKDGGATFTFEDVPYGDYAVKVFHDENDNQKVDMGWRGPTERYGFSNGARGLMGPPKWEAARFTLSQPALQVAIEAK
jgi:uncharacterized protein (DUF2141 family)